MRTATARSTSLRAALLASGLLWAALAVAEDALRPEVGKPLQAAQELIKAQKFKEALTRVKEAEMVPARTAYENYIIERMRGAAAAGAGDNNTAAQAFELVLASGRLAGEEQLRIEEALSGTYYRNGNYAKAAAMAQRYLQEGGSRPQVRDLLIQAQYMSGDYAGAAKALVIELASDDAAGRVPSEERLKLLANCNLRQKDLAAYAGTLERLVSHYPKREYWADLLARIQRKPGFSDRLALDVFRLQRATGNLQDAADYVEMAQLALQAGLPGEAKLVLEEGFSRALLGKGNDAGRHQRLRDMASRQAADDARQLAQAEVRGDDHADGPALFAAGWAHFSRGQAEKGIALMEKGLAKGKMKRIDEARLHLGEAYLHAGDKAKAQHMLHSVQGADGSADLARLWLIYGR